MVLEKNQFPVTIQAYELNGDTETFIAEQVVNSQAEIDAFSNRYLGKLIKAKGVPATNYAHPNTATTTTTNATLKKNSSAGSAIVIVLIILLILLAIGWYTGWIQRTFGLQA